MKTLSAFLVLVVFVLSTLSGCDKGGAGDPKQAFQTASPETQMRWQQANEAAKTNDYVTAVLTFKKLQVQADLTPSQQQIVAEQMAAVNESLAIAEKKGDPEAKKAMETIRQLWRSH